MELASEQEKFSQCNFFGPPRDRFREFELAERGPAHVAWRPGKTTLEKFFLLRRGAIAAAATAAMAMAMMISIQHLLYDMGFS